jgi:hypothetical protein
MAQFYLNNKPITQGLAVHHLANALPNDSLRRVREIVQMALMGHRFAVKQLADYGLHIGSV